MFENKRIGIFAGSFNPPHLIHQKIANDLIDNNYLDKVIFLPTGNSYQKNDLISFNHRFKMLQLITNNDILVSDYENKEELIYSYQSLDHFKEKYPNNEIYLITSSEWLDKIKDWKNGEYILANFSLIVVGRKSYEFKNNEQYKKVVFTNLVYENISSTEIRKQLLSNQLEDINLDKNVLKYIKENNLYQEE